MIIINFTEEMKQIIIDTYPQYGINETIKKLGLTEHEKYDVQHIAQKLKLKRVGKYFTDKEFQYLKDNYSNSSVNEISTKLHRSKSVIVATAHRLGLSNDIYYYSKNDIEYLKNNYGKIPIDEICEHLNKSYDGIITKANKLNLYTREDWSDEEIAILKDVYPNYTNQKISKDFLPKRNATSIATMAHKFDLVKSKAKSVKWYDMKDMLKDLYKVAIQIGRTPFCFELKSYGLASDKTYERYFGTYRQACMEAGLSPNASMIGNQNIHFDISSNGSMCLSGAEKYICDYLDDNEIQYKKEIFYKDYINDDRCGNKRFDWMVNDYFIEYFGLMKYKKYSIKTKEKIQICKDNKINLIALYPKDLKKLDEKLHILLQ